MRHRDHSRYRFLGLEVKKNENGNYALNVIKHWYKRGESNEINGDTKTKH